MNRCKKQRIDHAGMYRRDVRAEIESLFDKRFSYQRPTDKEEWHLPELEDICNSDPQEYKLFLALKESLNEVKNLLSDKKLDEWHLHTSSTNKAGRVIPRVRTIVNAELCTQAWCKFYEIVSSFPLLPQEALWNRELNSVHLCEAPGAFITSLNHYLKSQELHCDWNWVGNTLNPYYEANDTLQMIADDRFIAGTLTYWYFGPDNTGDVMTLNHLTGLQHFIGHMSCVHLVTADGSFDCQGNPGEQEGLVAALHYCEAITALMILGCGGSLVLKSFTFFEQASINLLYLLNCCFKKVSVFKPGTSKSGNSEVYVICLDYVGRPAVKPLLDKIVSNFGTGILNKALFPQHAVPDSFIQTHLACCMFFHKLQTETIHENLRLFEHKTKEDLVRLNALRDCAVEHFFEKFGIRYITKKEWIMKKPNVGCSLGYRWLGSRNRRSDTFNERKELESLPWEHKVLKGFFLPWVEEHAISNRGAGIVLEKPSCPLDCDDWYMVMGQRLPKVKCSPFCNGELLKSLNEAIAGLSSSGTVTDPSLQPCSSCCVLTEEFILAELSVLSVGHDKVQANENKDQFTCFVVGVPLLSHYKIQSNIEVVLLEPPSPYTCESLLLHDGDPRYQQHLLECILVSLQKLRPGSSLVLPILSCLTRFTAGLLFVLHHCFRLMSFVCPTSTQEPGICALLLCSTYEGLSASALSHMQMVSSTVSSVLDSPEQVLECVPMEHLLTGALLEFLWDLNSAIVKQRLHMIGRVGHPREGSDESESLNTGPT
ncbi:cap-specific mRNA (nucleoside-2'-O-)-methyltransferase 2 [Ambystoma mexicanum]|uniref:cap-specific mRNA (nucleoside-2'-O-)-methyltransferase 2 n=1 Tax=Ambystoma mexicanum TaxID=8296 RepID=UPI0037E9369F